MKLLCLAALVSAQIAWSPGNNVQCDILPNATVGGAPQITAGSLESSCCAAYATGVGSGLLENNMATNETLPQCYSLGLGQACDFSTVPTLTGKATALGASCMDNHACGVTAHAQLVAGNGVLNSAVAALATPWTTLCNATNTLGATASCKPYYGASLAAGRLDFGDQTFDCCAAASGLATYGIYATLGNVSAKGLIGTPCYAVGAGQSCDADSGAPTVESWAATLGVMCLANGTASACGDSALAGLKAANATLYAGNPGMIASWDPLNSNSLTTACTGWLAALANLTATTQAAATTAAATTAAASTAAGSTAASGNATTAASATTAANGSAATTAATVTTTTEAAGTTSGSYVAKALATLFFC